MNKRSKELRKVLTESLDPQKIKQQFHEAIESRYIQSDRVAQLRKNYTEEFVNIRDFHDEYQILLEGYEELSDEEFEILFQKAQEHFEVIIARINRYTQEFKEERKFTVDFADITQFEGLKEFVAAYPLLFIPRKEEVARILSVAKQMHERRVEKGEKEPSEPLRIVDIGGANGALGKLVVDLARENGLEIEYVVVDPDSPTVQEAEKYYQAVSALEFREQTGEDFNLALHVNNASLVSLLKERQVLVEQGERKRAELKQILDDIDKKSNKEEFTSDDIRFYLQIFHNDFEIELPISLAEDSEGFMAALEVEDDNYRVKSLADIFADRLRLRVNELTDEIEQIVGELPAQCDLVINSWMPVRMDLTKEVREANGAAIIYIYERYGATGCRSDAAYPEYPSRLGYQESYNPGEFYNSRLGWISHSTPQAQAMFDSQPYSFWQYQSSWTPPFANSFAIQIHKDYSIPRFNCDPRDAGIQVEGNYPWEEELQERGGDLSPVIFVKDRDGEFDCFSPFHNLASKLEQEERRKRDRDVY